MSETPVELITAGGNLMADERVPVVVLRDHLKFHAEAEGKILDEYVKVIDGTKSKALRYLADLIVEDEHRHHQLFRDLARTFDYAIDGVGSKPTIPALDFDLIDGAETLAIIDRLLRFEVEDKNELKDLKRRFRSFGHGSLFELLIELMQRDTDKHIAILRFAKKHTKRKGSSRPNLNGQ